MSSSPIQKNSSPVLRERTEDTNFAVQGIDRLTAEEADLAVHQTCPNYIHFYTMNRIISSTNISVERAWKHVLGKIVVVVDGKEKDVERAQIRLEVVVTPPGTSFEIVDCSSNVAEYHHRRHEHTGKQVSLDARTYPSFETQQTVASTRPPVERVGSLLNVLKIVHHADTFTPASWKDLTPAESKELDKARDRLWGPEEKGWFRKSKPWTWYPSGVFSERRKIGTQIKEDGPLVRWGICRTEEQYHEDQGRKRGVGTETEAEHVKEDGRVKLEEIATEEGREEAEVSETAEESGMDGQGGKAEDAGKDEESENGGKHEESDEAGESEEEAESGKDSKCEKDSTSDKGKAWWKVEKLMKRGKREMAVAC